jgi:hypothetical protein
MKIAAFAPCLVAVGLFACATATPEKAQMASVESASEMSAGKTLSGSELRAALEGNTESGTYEWQGQKSGYYEYYKDGRISGHDRWQAYTGTYEIRDDGCLYIDYVGSSDLDGCYYYQPASGDTYRIKYPDGSSHLAEIMKGNPKGL